MRLTTSLQSPTQGRIQWGARIGLAYALYDTTPELLSCDCVRLWLCEAVRQVGDGGQPAAGEAFSGDQQAAAAGRRQWHRRTVLLVLDFSPSQNLSSPILRTVSIMKRKTMESFFKKVESGSSSQPIATPQVQNSQVSNEVQEQDSQVPNAMPMGEASQQPAIESDAYERDPGRRPQIYEYPPNQRDEVRRWLTFQACAFRGHDESAQSINQGNFLEMIKILASYNKEVKAVVLENAPGNAKYTSHHVQKEILNIFAEKVQTTIRGEIGTSKFCLIVDESRDESKKEQMAIVLRFVDAQGFIRERFLDIVHVKDTAALTLKNSICAVLSTNNLSVQDIRGQGYDGASNMRGEWNGLQALILKECPYAYYVHCMAHQLQLALIAASREVIKVHNFFQEAIHIINVVSSSAKRNDELITQQAEEIAHEIELGELDTGRGANQIVLRNLVSDRSLQYHARGDAGGCLKNLLSFDFVFIMHLMKEIMAITDDLCRALQQKDLDILNALSLVSTTKLLIQKLRDDGWEPLLEKVNSFCLKHEIELPDMNRKYVDVTKSRNKHDNTTVQHHYRVDIFTNAIDHQQKELNARFSEQSMELLTLSVALDPRDVNNFSIEKICTLVKRFYPVDFSDQERAQLEAQLSHYELDVCSHPSLQISTSLADLTRRLVETGKFAIYPMVDRLLRLIMTLPVSTATTERAFSAMKLIKTGLRNRMGDDFLRDYMIVYIEKEIAKKFAADEIIDMYDFLGSRRAKLKLIEM
ncbi:hypothetical protein LUZ63_005883 [Rhynchospora breviuscula]|uniref:Zinc finger MYM-type protein 1-like n=1 Tax=Rhynchospora breviuscula TaxID=2022672 RepID=A0A9Q0CNR6_9POAL|nr:hypothetical protein LUZ63_005883 [Rhynchospora breviuscula]